MDDFSSTVNPLTGLPYTLAEQTTMPSSGMVGAGMTAPVLPTVNPLGATGPAPLAPASRSLLTYAKNPTPVPNGAAGPGGLMNVASRANVAGLDPDYSKRLAQFQADAKAHGIETSIISGYRDDPLQAKLRKNYEAKLAGQPLPYPEEGTGGIAAKPGMSPHNHKNPDGTPAGLAVDMYAADPKNQPWLIANAPKYGMLSGSSFGDPGHFQDAKFAATNGGHATPTISPGASPSETASVVPADTTPADTTLAGTNSSFNPKGLYTMAMLASMFPQHKFTPVDYNPYKVMPHQPGVGN